MLYFTHRGMDKKSKILLTVLVVLTVASVGYTYYNTMVLRQFEIIDYVP